MAKSHRIRNTKTGNEVVIVDGALLLADLFGDGMSRVAWVGTDSFVETIEGESITSIRVETLSVNWERGVWIDSTTRITEPINTQFTLRKERRGQMNHWYAYRRRLGKLFKRYVGKSEDITEDKLVEIASKLPS